MPADNRQEILARWTLTGTAAQGYIAAPGSGATITIFDSGSRENTATQQQAIYSKGVRWKRVCMSSYASHDSGANGVTFEASFDNGTNWRTMYSYTDTTAGAPNIHWVATPWPRWRVRYVNSANVLTAWEGSLMGDEYERGTA